MYGTQTMLKLSLFAPKFENDVKMYGTQTQVYNSSVIAKFENDVKMYGTQTQQCGLLGQGCLRMM